MAGSPLQRTVSELRCLPFPFVVRRNIHRPWQTSLLESRGPSVNTLSPSRAFKVHPMMRSRRRWSSQAILAARQALYASVRGLNPARWSGKKRNRTTVSPETLNPERHSITNALSQDKFSRPLAA